MRAETPAAADAAPEDVVPKVTSFSWEPIDPVADFEGASKIYRSCRDAGITPRGLIDCMIANVAVRTGAELLTADRDFAAMARVLPLRLAS